MPSPYIPIHWPSWWPRPSGGPSTPPPLPEGPAPEPRENAFQNWARRLIIGPRSIVQQRLADAAALEREEHQQAQLNLREQWRAAHENIREQARARREDVRARIPLQSLPAEVRGPLGLPETGELPTAAAPNIISSLAAIGAERRKAEAEQGRLSRLSRVAGMLRQGFPPEELAAGVPGPETLAGLVKTETERKMLFPEPEEGMAVAPGARVVGKRTGRLIAEGAPKPEKSFFENKGETELIGMLGELKALPTPTPEQRARIPLIEEALQTLQARLGERAGVRATATAEAQRALPAKNWQNWFQPEQMAAAPSGLSEAQLLERGYIELDAEQRKATRALKQVSGTITVLRGLADKIITATTPLEAQQQAIKYGGSMKLAALAALTPAAKVYHDDVEGFLGPLSRSPLVAERGVLTNQDIERMRKVFPWFGDTAAIKDMKFTILEYLLTSARDAAIRGYLFDEKPSTQYEAQKQKFLRQLESLSPVTTPKPGTPVKIHGKAGEVLP